MTKKITRFTTPSDREIVTTRVVDAPLRLVWPAWTECKHLTRWMLGPPGWTMPVCQMDLRPGGAIRWVWRREDGTEMEIRGTVKEVTPPTRFVYTESWGAEWPETINTLTLSEQRGTTTIVVTMLFPSKEARDAAMKTGMAEGWSRSYELLETHLRTMAG